MFPARVADVPDEVWFPFLPVSRKIRMSKLSRRGACVMSLHGNCCYTTSQEIAFLRHVDKYQPFLLPLLVLPCDAWTF